MELADQGWPQFSIASHSHQGTPVTESDLRYRQILLDADEFVTKYGLDDIRGEIRAGALLLETHDNLESIEGLTEEAIAALKTESAPKAFLSLTEIFTWWRTFPCVCTIGGLLFGYMENLSPLLLDVNVPGSPQEVLDSFSRVFKSSIPSVVCYALGAWAAVPLLRCFARRSAVFSVLGVRAAGIVAMLAFPYRITLMVNTLLYSTVSGMILCIIPIYLAETSPTTKRGSIIIAWQLVQRIGGWLTPQAINNWNLNDHRSLVGICISALLSIAAFGMCFWVSPESPIWSARHGNYNHAYKALRRYRENNIQASRDLYRIHSVNNRFKRPMSQSNPNSLRRALHALIMSSIFILSGLIPEIMGLLLMIALSTIMLSGQEKDLNQLLPFLLPYAGVLLLSVLLLANFVERIGRRRLTTTCMIFVSLILVIMRLVTLDKSYISSEKYLPLPMLLLTPYMALLWVPMLYATEVSCSTGYEFVMAASLTLAFLRDATSTYSMLKIVKYALPRFDYNYCLSAPLALFIVVQIALTLLVYAFTIETKAQALEDIGAALDFPLLRRAAYRFRVYLPYFFKRYCLWRRVACEPFEESRYATGQVRLEDGDGLPAP
ncbi:hypothetical protein BJX66DRAFT_332482 [Aspergillus keveii]|uniref:MFS transporter n=1 Tax=Aspergillus keveii TaxID=714993 RepID=A0ABR4GN34_9EURO